jgi:hypothetical protein
MPGWFVGSPGDPELALFVGTTEHPCSEPPDPVAPVNERATSSCVPWWNTGSAD